MRPISVMLDKEAGGALDNLQRRYERDQDAMRDKIERGQQYMNDLPIHLFDDQVGNSQSEHQTFRRAHSKINDKHYQFPMKDSEILTRRGAMSLKTPFSFDTCMRPIRCLTRKLIFPVARRIANASFLLSRKV